MARLVPILAFALVLAGCGGATGTAGQALGAAAEIAPASAHAFAVVRTDGDAQQTRAALDLLGRFPVIADHGLDLERDVLPALGDEAGLVALPGREHVWLARPADRERLEELLGRLDRRPASREIEGWTVLARDDRALDALEREREGGTLADDASFRAAFDSLPADAFAKLWTSDRADGPLRGAVAAVRAEEDGFGLEGRRAAEEGVEAYRAGLLDRVPAGASLVASFRGPGGLAERLDESMLPLGPLAELQSLAEVLEGEGVLYVRRAVLVPELTLLTEVEDEEEAAESVRRLLERLGTPGRANGRSTGGSVRLGPLTISYGVRDGVLAVTTAAAGLGVLDPSADPIGDDRSFAETTRRAGLPEETTGFLYVQIDELAPLLGTLGALQGSSLPPGLSENLQPLGSLVLFGTRDGDRETVAGFLEIR